MLGYTTQLCIAWIYCYFFSFFIVFALICLLSICFVYARKFCSKLETGLLFHLFHLNLMVTTQGEEDQGDCTQQGSLSLS